MNEAITLDVRDTVKIPLATLKESKNQARKFVKDADFKALVAGMLEIGLIQPITVRPVDGGHEIIFGHRRVHAAAHLEWTHIEANISNASDSEADEMRVVENMHRKDLLPWEEGKEIATLLKKYSSEEIGILLNMTPSMIARRNKLSTLTKLWIKALSAPHPKLDVTGWSIAAVEEIARLPSDIQNKALSMLIDDWDAGNWDVRTLRDWLEDNFLMNLDTVGWDLDEDKIAGQKACNKCPKRANCQESLFEDLKGSNKCLDSNCFNKKIDVIKTRVADAATEKHGDKVVLIDESVSYHVEGSSYAGRLDYEKCKKNDPGARRAVNVTGTTAGKPIWVNKKGAENAPKTNGPLSDNEKLSRVEKKRAKHVTQQIITLLQETNQHPMIRESETVLALISFVVTFGISTGADVRQRWYDEGAWSHALVRSDKEPGVSKDWCDIFETIQGEQERLNIAVWNQVRMVLIEHFEFLLKYAPSLREVEFCLSMIRLGEYYDRWYEEAVEAVKLPKALAKNYDKYGGRIGGIG